MTRGSDPGRCWERRPPFPLKTRVTALAIILPAFSDSPGPVAGRIVPGTASVAKLTRTTCSNVRRITYNVSFHSMLNERGYVQTNKLYFAEYKVEDKSKTN